jgi:transcriptional regulator with XRE-family HTH domain
MPKEMVSIRKILALNLKAYRDKLGLTQEKFAEKAGISSNYLSMVEICQKFPTPEMLDRLAEALEIQTFQLFDPAVTPEGAVLHLEKSILVNIDKRQQQAINDIKKVIKETLEEKK